MAADSPKTNTFETFSTIGIREDLSDLISEISPTETPVYSNIGSAAAENTFFEWQSHALTAADENHQVEGFDVTTFTASSTTTRLGNYTSISSKDFIVSGTNDAVNRAGRGAETAFQLTRVMKELKRDVEVNICKNNAAVAGSSGTPRETGGLGAWIKTNADKASDGTHPSWNTAPTGARAAGTARAFTETLLKATIKLCYDAGAEPTMCVVGSFNKQAASAFAGIAQQRYMAPGDSATTIVGAADLYLSDFGTISFVASRFSEDSLAYLLDPDRARMRVLRPFQASELAKSGDATKFMALCEMGLQVDQEDAHGVVADLTTS